jgi:N-acetylneuraminic acid mutarotase
MLIGDPDAQVSHLIFSKRPRIRTYVRGQTAKTGLASLLAAALLVLALPALAAADGWAPATSMSAARSDHTATLLPNGKVLVTGGRTSSYSSTVQLYTPATNSWAPAASMGSARSIHTATLLNDGTVLVAGGYSGPIFSSAERYDPTTNSWSAAGSMGFTTNAHTATLLPSGKVLVAGGGDFSGYHAKTAIYDPVANSWSAGPSMSDQRYTGGAALLPSGKVLLVGGYGPAPENHASADLYDPSSNTISAAAPMSTPRRGFTTTSLPGGKVLVAGGCCSAGAPMASAEIYDSATNSWSAAAPMGTARIAQQAALLPSGKVLVTGGYTGVIFTVTTSAEVYDPGSDSWSPVPPMSVARASFTATLLPNGKVLAAGGYNGSSWEASTELYDTTAPDTVIDSGPADPTQLHSASFTFHGTDADDEAGSLSFECSLDEGAYAPCSSGEPFSAGEGHRSFDVRASDPAGNTDASPAHYEWTVDNTAPEISIVTPENKEHFTLDESVTPSYFCADPLSGSPPDASGVAGCSDEGFSTEVLGPHLFTVNATDKAGNSSSRTVAYVIDPPRYADFVLEDSPIAYYRLNEVLGSNPMLDSSGNGHGGEYKNGVVLRRTAAPTCERRPHPPHACQLNNDPQDYAAYFPPRDGYGYVNGIGAPSDEYSLEAWVKPADGANMMIAAHGGGGQIFISAGHLAFRQTQDTIVASGPAGEVPPGTWTHVAASWDGHTSRLYVNGQQVVSSSGANKAPSGISTFYVGYGDQAPWFHGHLDEVAYYDRALDADSFADHWEIGTAQDYRSPSGPGSSLSGLENTNTAIPYANIDVPVNNATYAPGKVPDSGFDCSDLDGSGDIASCIAQLDGSPIESGDPLSQVAGSHEFTLIATDQGGNVYAHTHTFTVEPYADVVRSDDPLAYYRLDDGAGAATMADDTLLHGGAYLNGQDSGPVGVSGDGNRARSFFGAGGYGYVNGIAAPTSSSSMEAWVNPADGRSEAVMGHGDGGELDIVSGHFSYRHMDKTLTAQIGPGEQCSAPTPGSWAHVVGVWDGVEQKIYVNGELCGQLESTRRPSSISTFYVGYGELAPWFAGSLDEVGYYSSALSAERVYEHYIADPPAGPSAGGGARPGEVASPATVATTGGGSEATPVPAQRRARAHRTRRHRAKHRHRWSRQKH